MKRTIAIALFSLLISCSTTSKIDWSNSYWGVLESSEAYLYTADSLSSIVEKEIKQGSILFFHTRNGDFQEVYIRNPKKIDIESRKNFRYYLYKPKYKKLTVRYNKDYASVYEIPFDPNQTYITGERGGCYYINRHGNKTYVNRSYCDIQSKTTPSPKPTPRYIPKSRSNCSTVQCSGRTQKGARCQNKTTNCSGRCHLH